MESIPKCRESQFHKIVDALLAGVRALVITGPMSSGKTITVDSIISSNVLECKAIHAYCETGLTLKDLFQRLAGLLKKQDRKIKTFQTFFDEFKDYEKTVIFFDSFDLLQDVARDAFLTFQAAVDSNLLPQFSFVFISRQNCSFFSSDPLQVFFVDFQSYSVDQIRQIVMNSKEHDDPEAFEAFLNRAVKVCEPVTHDVRDIIYITYKSIKDQEEIKNEDDTHFTKRIVHDLRDTRIQESSRVTDLARAAGLILLATYIGCKTSPASDLLKLSRTAARSRKHQTLKEAHEFVPLGRVFAITKALNFHHTDNFDFDFGVNIQLNTLLEKNLIEVRGDPRTDAKVRILATDDEVEDVAENLGIDLDNYTGEE